jgi:hypothetical protein
VVYNYVRGISVPRHLTKSFANGSKKLLKGDIMAQETQDAFAALVESKVKEILCKEAGDGATQAAEPVVTETSSKSIEGKASSGADDAFAALVESKVKEILCKEASESESPAPEPVVTETSSKSIEGKASSGGYVNNADYKVAIAA